MRKFYDWLKDFFELAGIHPTTAKVRVWKAVLGEYSLDALESAMIAFASEKRRGGPILPADVLVFLPSKLGHPSTDVAWNYLPKSEGEGGYVTTVMMSARADCADSLRRGDLIAARLAFFESYRARLRAAEAQRQPAKFFYTSGTGGTRNQQLAEREAKTLEAIQNGWISTERGKAVLGEIAQELLTPSQQTLAMLDRPLRLVGGTNTPKAKPLATGGSSSRLAEDYTAIRASVLREREAEAQAKRDREAALAAKRALLMRQVSEILRDSPSEALASSSESRSETPEWH